MGEDQNPEVHPETGMKISQVASLERLSWGSGRRVESLQMRGKVI